MSTAAYDRLSELREHLHDVLEELGLTATLSDERGSSFIQFRYRDGTSSAVAIKLNQRALQDYKHPWYQSQLEIDDNVTFQVGDNGWTYWQPGTTSYAGLKRDAAQAFGQIERALRHAPPRPSKDDIRVTSNAALADAYDEIKLTLENFGDPKLLCARIDGVECLTFVDRRDRSWRISYVDLDAIVFVDETIVGTFPADQPMEICLLIEDALFDLPRSP